MRPSLFVLVLAGMSSLPCHAQNAKPEPPEDTREFHLLWPEGAPYAHGEEETDRPRVFPYLLPEDQRNGAAVVVCPGGGYGGLAADHEGHQIGEFLNSFGVTAFVLHYRLGTQDYHYPTQLADVQRALRWVRHRAPEYGIDPQRIGVMGFSAGGHLTSMAGTLYDRKAYEAADETDQESARPDFMILCYPVISMSTDYGHKGSRVNLIGDPKVTPDSEAARSVSSELNVTDDTPPAFIFQTMEDTVVPAQNSLLFYNALLEHGIPSEMHIYQKGPHGVGLFRADPNTGAWSNQLKRWMRGNGILGSGERAAISGEVTLDGLPVSWGGITFTPEDPDLPTTTLRIRRGKFSAPAESGPIVGKSAVTFEASIWEQTRAPEDGVIRTDRLSPDSAEPLSVAVKAGKNEVSYELKSR